MVQYKPTYAVHDTDDIMDYAQLIYEIWASLQKLKRRLCKVGDDYGDDDDDDDDDDSEPL